MNRTVSSAMICTRNRPDDVVRAVASLLANEDDFELLVVDQSDGSETERALMALSCDHRLRYVRSQTRGKGAALNEGLRLARGEVVVCTDDDCEAAPGWVRAMTRAFEDAPSAAVAFCRVDSPPYDHAAGYIPDFQQPRRLVRSVAQLCGRRGLGAGMAVRRDVVLEMGGFDELLGPGSKFMSGDDVDMAVRVLLRGWHVFNTGDRPILHHGFRTREQGRDHARRDFISLGAVCAKPLRAGYARALPLPMWELFVNVVWPPVADLLALRRPHGVSRISAFLVGFARGLRAPLDRRTLLFLPASEEGASRSAVAGG